MQDLRVIGVENGALLVAADDGERFRIPVDEVLQSKLRQATPDPGNGRKLAPREIQAHIRAGMSAQDVASITGVSLEYIQKFEGPVLAEREFVVETALAVPVHTADLDPSSPGVTFGTVIRERLHELGAVGERWASWKEMASGWVVKLSFTANQIDHDARWSFDPRKNVLAPLNAEAIQLSQQGAATSGPLIPRLRAVADVEPDASRFDSGAFHVDESAESEDASDRNAAVTPVTVDLADHAAPERPAPQFARTSVSDDEPPAHSQTADLLEALRRRRGERESAGFGEDDEDARAAHPSTGGIHLVDVPLAEFDGPPASQRQTGPQGRARKGRVAMPSWDEIVFGARPDDDPA